MTKVIILGEPTEQKQGKKIEFVTVLGTDYKMDQPNRRPMDWQNIELICRNYDASLNGAYDLMFAYDNNRNMGVLYIGHFNDGIV